MKFLGLLTIFTALLCCSLHANLAAGEKKKDDQKPDLKETIVNDELTNADLKDKTRTASFCKTYVYKMTEGRTYQIDMRSNAFDSYLRLESPDGTQVAFDDDGGGFPHARISYRAPKNGDYTIICTTFSGGATGKYTLVVKDTQSKPAAPPKDKVIDKFEPEKK